MEKTILISRSQHKLKKVNRIKLGPRFRMTVLMLIADCLGWFLAFSLIWILSLQFEAIFLGSEFIVFVMLYFGLAIARHLYPAVGLNPAEEMRNVVSIQFFSIGLVFIIALLFHSFTITNHWLLLMLGCTSTTTILFSRWQIRIASVQLGWWGEPVVVLGQAENAQLISDYFLRRRRLGFVPVLAAVTEKNMAESLGNIKQISLDNLVKSRIDRFSSQKISTVLVDLSGAQALASPVSNRALFRLFRRVVFLSNMDWAEGASVNVRDYEGLLGMEFRKNLLNPTTSIIKRGVDILGALFLGISSIPILVWVAIAIKCFSNGPLIYAQNRIGKGGHVIKIFKFRTMVKNAEQVLSKHLDENPASKEEWLRTQKLRNDPRITRPGKWIRRFSLDELPQLWNVLKGEMSLVGPRPIMVGQELCYGDRFDVYTSVHPGLTGMWQVSGRNNTTFEERAHFDTYYVRNWSSWLDIYILARTIWVVLTQDGAY